MLVQVFWSVSDTCYCFYKVFLLARNCQVQNCLTKFHLLLPCGSGFRNVPYDWINKQKSNQNWLRKEGDKFLFPGGGTMFPRGVGAYVDLMQDLIPEMKDGTIRTAIDTGCGVSHILIFILVSEIIRESKFSESMLQ